KERRYASAAELAADLRRFLRREPIAAQPPSGWYRMQRFTARNKPLVAGAAATVLALVLGLVLTVWQRDQAREALARAEGINEFLLHDLIASPSPERLGYDVRVADVLAPAVISAERSFADQPRVAAEVLDAIGASYRSLGLVENAEPVARRALELLGEGTQDRLTLRARGNMVRILTDLDRAGEAVPMGEQNVLDSTALLGAEDQDTLDRRVELAGARWSAGEVQISLDAYEAVAADQARLFGADDPETLSTRSQLAVNLAGAGKVPEAQAVLRETLAGQERVLGDDHPSTLNSRSHLAWILTLGSEWKEGAELYAEHIPVLERVYGPDHSYTALARVNHAQCLLQIQRAEEAEAIVRKGIASLEERLGEGHTSTLKGRLILAKSLYRQDQGGEAIRIAEEVVARRRVDGSAPDNLGQALSTLGLCYQQAGRLELAAQTYREATPVLRSVYGDDADYVAQMQYNLAVVTGNLRDYDSAIPAYEEAIRIDAHNWGADHGHVVSDRFNLARTLLSAERPEQALEQIQMALASAATLDLDRLRILGYREVLGRALIATGESEAGEAILVEVVEGYAEQPDARPAQAAAQALVALYEKQGRSAEAATYRKRLR
ncbi:MAG: tetratricopeptide repeat protein, partial [Planctomycetota bacterium]